MKAYHTFLNELINRNKQEFSGNLSVNWLNLYTVHKVQDQRNSLCEDVSWLFKKTKPYYNKISPGCQICGDGKWSCLFITNQCNASCFYCPTSQNNDEIPGTQNLTFETPEAYAEYINYFEFSGVSFSGGEPFLFFEKTLSYLKALREMCSPNLYIWIYTNGILVNDDKLKQLAELGLNEIRFDIGATNYNISNLKNAAKYIPNVSVEIPAVPEEFDTIINLLPELIKSGVSNLNLHQMRLTKYNYNELSKKAYTYIPAERPLVLESEICALKIMQFARNAKLEIGINYCSFHFKNRFQKAGYRKVTLNKLADKDAIITENGYLRVLTDKSLHYDRLILSDSIEDTANSKEMLIKNKRYFISLITVSEKWQLDTDALNKINIQLENSCDKIPTGDREFKIWQHEKIEEGLREY